MSFKRDSGPPWEIRRLSACWIFWNYLPEQRRKMIVVGLDVCKGSVVACMLDADKRPTKPRQLYYDLDFPTFQADAKGLRDLLSLNPDVAVMEPTGTNYSKIWAAKLTQAGVAIALVGHIELRNYRKNLGLSDKDDAGDALALACYYLEHKDSSLNRFVRMRDPIVAQMRDVCLRIIHLNRSINPTINRIRQDLAWQFPEVADISLDARLFWGWLAGERKSHKYDAKLASSIGLGLIPETVSSAIALSALHEREAILTARLRDYLKDPRFGNYRKVFSRFGFGEKCEAILISQIYPLQNYLASDGKPETRRAKGKISRKATIRHLSLRRFQKALGVAPTREESGSYKSARMRGGSSLCRLALWQWIFTRIEPKRTRLRNPIGQHLGAMLDLEKERNVPVKLARSRVCAKAVRILFYELINAVTRGSESNNAAD